mmetsp:Transcript_19230/g.36063  ORF Transcript_19230/g.36063 Transcript_19230/m.36063 type:complete len:328 (+) Transcript_19230:459-1442(+)
MCGVVTVDGSEASLGKTQLGSSRSPVVPLSHLRSNLKGRTRRGGQSAPRFGRTRDAEELEFLREVAEQVESQLAGASHLVLGGKADMKRKLLKQLAPTMQQRVLAVVDLNCGADRDSLRQAALRAPDPAGHSEESAVKKFLQEVKLGGGVYGRVQTTKALELGAVGTLLLAADGPPCEVQSFLKLAEEQGTPCLLVSAVSEDSACFCSSFAVGGLLRWDPTVELMEEGEEQEAETEEGEATPLTTEDSDSESTEQPTEEVSAALLWLEREVAKEMSEAEAESLRDVAAVLLGDGLEPLMEVLRGEGVSERVLSGFELLCCGIHVRSD